MRHVPPTEFYGRNRSALSEPLALPSTAGTIQELVPRSADLSERLRAAAGYSEYIYWVADASGSAIDVSHQWTALTGLPAEQSLGRRWCRLVHPEDYKRALKSWREAYARGNPFACELRFKGADGEYRWTQMRAKPELNARGQPIQWLGTLANITDRKKAEILLLKSEALSRGVIEASADCIQLLTIAGDIEFMNGPGLQALEIDDFATIKGRTWCSLWPAEGRAAARNAVRAAVEGKAARFTAFCPTAKGTSKWWDVVVTPMLDSKGEPNQLLAVARDTTLHRNTSERLRHASEHDVLTGLANRRGFRMRLDSAALRAMQEGTLIGLLLLDLDHFKTVNDTLGHSAGDHLLKQLSARLLENSSGHDFVARLGGDEFAIVVENLRNEDDLVGTALSLLKRLEFPIYYEGRVVSSQVSIGGAVFPRDAANANDLLKNADAALYSIKGNGGAGVTMFHHHMRQQAQLVASQLSLARTAISEKLIVPFYQPKVRLSSGEIYGFEALLRWRHPGKGLQPPGTIAEAFNDYQLASAIGELIQDAVAGDIASWRKAGVTVGSVAINASPAEFLRNDYAERLLMRLERARVKPCEIEVEVTEHAFFGHAAEYVGRAIAKLSMAGVRISLDDFGTGYSSLSHLKDFAVDVLKIDRSFVSEIERGGESAAIVSAVVGLANNLALAVVAEGVETRAQKDFLVDRGCAFGQGYLFGYAVPADEVPRLLSLSA